MYSHPALTRPGIQPIDEPLYVVAVLENPLRWQSRYRNYWSFQKHIKDSGAKLVTVELAYGSEPFHCTTATDPWSVQLRARDMMFHKENLGNKGLHRLPLGAKYVAMLDADMMFTRTDWVQETLHQLQHFDAVQMFSTYSDLGGDHRAIGNDVSFMWSYWNDREKTWLGAPGGGWAYRIETLRRMGGLLDRCILGAADHHMAVGLVGDAARGLNHHEMMSTGDAYRDYVLTWQRNAQKLQRNMGYVDGHMVHLFHGPRAARGYNWRWQILQDYKFDPYRDLRENEFGVYEFTEERADLRDAVRGYLRSRQEDSQEAEPVKREAAAIATARAAAAQPLPAPDPVHKPYPQPKPTAHFSAEPPTIERGNASRLEWKTTHATSATLETIGKVPTNGHQQVRPEHTTSYSLTARGPGGTLTVHTTVTVLQKKEPA
ncbi:MAG: hypothetical protein WBD45_05815 [Terriglobales bacterium]